MPKAAARWIVPAAVTAVVIGGGVAASASTDAVPDLPDRTAEELLVAVGEAEPTPFSGTVRTVATLGLPDLGAVGGAASSGGASDPQSALMSLLSGDNELRVWVGGPEQQRVSLVDDFAELDVIRDGDVVWTYASTEDTATRYDLAEARARFEAEHADELAELEQELEQEAEELPASPYAGLTPDELARTLLADVDPTTEVAVGEPQVVAGRDAYTLLATPRDEATLVGTIEVAVDAETGLVLQVEVGARDQAAPAFVSGFTSLDLSAPDADVFAFTPPPGTTVVDALEAADAAKAEAEAEAQGSPAPGEPSGEAPEPVVHGEGWSTAVELALPADASAPAPAPTDQGDGDEGTGDEGEQADPMQLLEQLTTPVDGGRVLTSALVTVLLTDDGRVLVGAVDAATLQSYAG
jgi:outer membrane lipoprotein-sorting protein